MLESTYDQTLAALISALDARDRETEGHSLRVSHLTARLGEALNFSHEQLKVLEHGSLLHDIGKIGISDTILHKPGPLSEEEWVVMRRHPDIGAKIVEGFPSCKIPFPLSSPPGKRRGNSDSGAHVHNRRRLRCPYEQSSLQAKDFNIGGN